MEDSLRQLWSLCQWYAGINATVTVGIFGYLIHIHSKITLGNDIGENIQKMTNDIEEIKSALKGTYDKPGLITKHYELEKRVGTAESKLEVLEAKH